MESKPFELAVEGGSTRLRIREKCRGFTSSIFLGRIDSCWLLDAVEELLSAKSYAVFWKRSWAGFPGIIAQQCANKHGHFLVVEEYGGGRRGFILVPKRRNDKGWMSFVLELWVVVKYTQSIYGGGNNKTMSEQKFTVKVGEERSFAR